MTYLVYSKIAMFYDWKLNISAFASSSEKLKNCRQTVI